MANLFWFGSGCSAVSGSKEQCYLYRLKSWQSLLDITLSFWFGRLEYSCLEGKFFCFWGVWPISEQSLDTWILSWQTVCLAHTFLKLMHSQCTYLLEWPAVRGAKLFNCIPLELRSMEGTVEHFKAGLDAWLSTVPDEPTVPGCPRAALTNSLLDQTALYHLPIPT